MRPMIKRLMTSTVIFSFLSACSAPVSTSSQTEVTQTWVFETSSVVTDETETGGGHNHVHTGMTVNTKGDLYSDSACKNNGVADVKLQLASTMENAGTVVFSHYEDGNKALITMPKTGDGYMVLQIFDWMADVRFFTDENVIYTVTGGDAFERVSNPSCPELGMTDQLIWFQEWNTYIIQFDDSSPSEFWFHVVKKE